MSDDGAPCVAQGSFIYRENGGEARFGIGHLEAVGRLDVLRSGDKRTVPLSFPEKQKRFT